MATLVRLCFDAGAKTVKVGDNPCDLARQVLPDQRHRRGRRRAGAEVVLLDRSRFRETTIGGERVKTLPLFPEILECDLVINVPIVKHHVLASATLCMKNYMGVMEKRNSSTRPSPPAWPT